MRSIGPSGFLYIPYPRNVMLEVCVEWANYSMIAPDLTTISPATASIPNFQSQPLAPEEGVASVWKPVGLRS